MTTATTKRIEGAGRIYVVETLLKSKRRWYVWTPCVDRKAAWASMRKERAAYHDQLFRVRPYERVGP